MRRSRFRRLLLSLAACCLLLSSSGCFFATLQTPETLQPGRMALSGSVASALPIADLLSAYPSLLSAFPRVAASARFGLVHRLDIGLTGSLPLGWLADVKYQFSDHPVPMAADLGLSYKPTFDDGVPMIEGSSSHTIAGLQLALLAGTERFYYGAKVIGARDRIRGIGWATSTDYHVAGGVLAGMPFGRRVQVIPELGLFYEYITHVDDDFPERPWHEGSPVVSLGCAVRYDFHLFHAGDGGDWTE